jgi:Sigma-54 interaction domain
MRPVSHYDKRHHLLSPAAFGIHHLVSKDLQTFFEERLHHSTFFFYEYFLEKPYTRWDDIREPHYDTQAVTAPFLSRQIYKTGFIPALNLETLTRLQKHDDIGAVPLTDGTLKEYWSDLDTMRIKVEYTDLLRALLENWLGSNSNYRPGYYAKNTYSYLDQNGVATEIGGLSTDYLRGEYLENTILRAKSDTDFAESALAKLREFELVLRPWLRSPSVKEIGFVASSLSSQSLFWGECIVLCPMTRSEHSEREPSWMADLKDILSSRIKSTYAPMLALLENYMYEEELQDKLRPVKSDIGKRTLSGSHDYWGINESWIRANSNYFCEVGSGTREPYPGGNRGGFPPAVDHAYLSLLNHCTRNPSLWKTRLSKLERALVELWADRFAIILADAYVVKESLIFTKYLIASPAMVDCTLRAIALRHMAEHPEKGKDRAVKTALVIGGPGSGKDSMAQLIRLFSPGYRFGSAKTLNMAMFRPKEVAVPLLLGLEASRGSMGSGEGTSLFSLMGVLHRVIARASDSTDAEAKDLSGQVDARTVIPRRGVTLILDELNSLDMDTQGALLRLLENAELQPLGGLEPTLQKMDLLIVGVMNEDPQIIMKKRAMERVLREKQFFGGVLGEALYEMFRNQRRLRDDLYYRLIRGGEIHLPELRERREDIPILFYFTVRTDLLSLIPEEVRGKWEIELPVYEALMDASLQWEGNLRELQTVARRIVIAAVDEYEARRSIDTVASTDPILMIKGGHARKVLHGHRDALT